jgi:hypothetical protein
MSMKQFLCLHTFVAMASLLGVTTHVQAEDMLVGEYRAAKNAAATRQWVSAAGEAIYTMNYRLESTGRQTLYCPPEKMRLATENYLQILDLELVRQGKRDMLGLMSVADILLDGLIRAFPCKK